jgi:hypothetical protein
VYPAGFLSQNIFKASVDQGGFLISLPAIHHNRMREALIARSGKAMICGNRKGSGRETF